MSNYILEFLTGDFEFLEYDEHTDINSPNELLLEFESLRPQEQEKVLLITNLNDNTIEAFHYAMNAYPKYTLLPDVLDSQEDIVKYVINEIYETPLLKWFGETIDYELSLLYEIGELSENTYNELKNDVIEIIKILSKSINTIRSKIK